jgi:transketolase
MPTIKPLDHEAIARAAEETGAIVVSEEHLVDAGLGLRVAQAVSLSKPCVMEYVGIENTYAESGTPEALIQKYGLTAAKVAEAARRAVRRK